MNENYQSQAKTRLITAVVAIVVIAGIVLLIEYFQHKPATNGSMVISSGPSMQPSGSSGNTGTASTTTYKDGTYTADSQYFVPHGFEDIRVTLTVKNNTVTDSQIENSESDPESAQFQEDFASEYKSNVVGKKVGDINLSFIAGASDTTNAFNDALNHIRQQAQA